MVGATGLHRIIKGTELMKEYREQGTRLSQISHLATDQRTKDRGNYHRLLLVLLTNNVFDVCDRIPRCVLAPHATECVVASRECFEFCCSLRNSRRYQFASGLLEMALWYNYRSRSPRCTERRDRVN